MKRALLWFLLVAGLACVLVDAALQYRQRVFDQGVAQERTRRDAIDARNSAAAERERTRLNAQVDHAQGALDIALEYLQTAHLELSNEKAISERRQSDLRAGIERERVLIRVVAGHNAAPGAHEKAGSEAAGGVGAGTGIEADLDPRVASWLEWVRANHNAAVARLAGCIASYDAVKVAADAMP